MTDPMTRLRDADPVADPPDAPPLDWLRLDAAPPRPRPRRRRRLVLAPALAAAVVALALGLSAGSSPDVLAEAREALGPQGGILHYVIRRPGAEVQRVEMWVAQDPLRERMEMGERGETFRSDYADGVHRAQLPGDDHVTVNRSTPERKDDYERSDPSPTGLGVDPLVGIRTMLDEGRLHEDGETELAGRRVVRLVGSEPEAPMNGTTRPAVEREFYVDAETFAPVRLVERWDQPHGTGVTDFERYERLPLTPENAQLLRVPGFDAMRQVDPNR